MKKKLDKYEKEKWKHLLVAIKSLGERQKKKETEIISIIKKMKPKKNSAYHIIRFTHHTSAKRKKLETGQMK